MTRPRDGAPRAAAWRLVTLLLVLAALALVTVRAVRIPVTHDEVLTWQAFLNNSWQLFFTRFSSNNHVLCSLLARFSIWLLGDELVPMRLPSLLAAASYLGSCRWLCLRLLGAGPVAALVLAVLAANPLLLEFFGLARGYALGLGFEALALVCFVKAREGGGALRWHCAASACQGLMVLANASFLTAGAALTLGAAVVELRRPERRALGQVVRLALALALPAALVLAPFAGLFATSERGEFGYGQLTLWAGLRSVIVGSLLYATPFGAEPASLGAGGDAAEALTWLALLLLVPLAVRGWRGGTAVADDVLALLGMALPGMLAILLVLHNALGLPYPYERTGLWLVPAYVLAVGLWLGRLAGGGMPQRVAAGLLAAPALGTVVLFVGQWQTGHSRTWKFDAGLERTLARLAELSRERGRPLRLGCDWVHYYGLDYYLRRHPPDWLAEIVQPDALSERAEVLAIDTAVSPPIELPGGDSRVPVRATIDRPGIVLRLRLTWRDPVSGAAVFVRG